MVMSTQHVDAPASTDVPLNLQESAPRAFGFSDQFAMWSNLGISLLGFGGALVVLQPLGEGSHPMGLAQAVLALVIGTLVGTAGVAAFAAAGARTGQPSMVMLRGLFGGRMSYLPTALNIVQLVGWGTFEIVTMTLAVRTLWDVPTWVVTVLIGAVATLLALYPLHWVKVLRKYVTIAVAVVLVYFAVQLGTGPLPAHDGSGWSGFGVAVDAIIGLSISWVPLAADYSRHSRTERGAVAGTYLGYCVTQLACYGVGIMALLLTGGDPDQVFGVFLGLTAGTVCFAVLALREIDQCFVDVYSSTVSLQNVLPRTDRRLLSVGLGALMTALALAVDIYGYASFLSLIAAVFVPLLGVFLVDYHLFSGHTRWDLGERSPARPGMVGAWLAGVVAYQMLSPGSLGWWSSFWEHLDAAIGFSPTQWTSASCGSFLVAAVLTVAVELTGRRRS